MRDLPIIGGLIIMAYLAIKGQKIKDEKDKKPQKK